MKFAIGVGALLLIAACLFFGVVWFFDGEPSDTASKWTAVYAVADWLTVLIAAFGLAALWIVRGQLEATQRQTRMETQPILRVDFGLDVETRTWHPPETSERYRYEYVDFQDVPAAETVLDEWSASDGHDLCLWVTNKQQQPGGTAYDIFIRMIVTMAPSRDSQQTAEPNTFDLVISYLEPARTLRIRLGTLDRIAKIAGGIDNLVYYDMNNLPLALAYGSQGFQWDGTVLHTYREAFDDKRRGFGGDPH